jgi:hypothetical protein
MPTKMATYPIQGAVRIERYCDRCAEGSLLGSRLKISRYMDIINGKTGIYADARRKWKRRLRKHKPSITNLYPSLNRKRKGNSLNGA